MPLIHAFVSAKSDGGDATQVQPSNWNAAHLTGAWTGWTPTVTATSGTYTSVSASGRYLQIDKLVFFHGTVIVTTLGTAAGRMIVTLPVTTLGQYVGSVSGWNISNSRVLGGAIALDAATTASFVAYDGTHPAVANSTPLAISGFYEAA